MERKNAAMLKSTPVKLDAAGKTHQAWLAKYVPVEGCEDAWARYLVANREAEEAYGRYDIVYRQVEREGGTSSCKTWPAFKKAGGVWAAKAQAAFGFLDQYLRATKMIGVAKEAEVEELRAIVGASLNDNLDGLGFNMNYGLLGAKVAQAIRHDVTEHEFMGIPYCEDHRG